MDLGAQADPALEVAGFAEILDAADGAIDGDPGHDFGMDEVAAVAANLPDAVVGLRPDLSDVIDERGLQRPGDVELFEAAATGLIEGIEHLAIDIELQLFGGCVADANGFGGFVAGEIELKFGETALAGDAVHDLHLVGSAGDGAQQPFAPSLGLVDEAGLHERVERIGGIAKPAEAIVPVADAADFFGQ